MPVPGPTRRIEASGSGGSWNPCRGLNVDGDGGFIHPGLVGEELAPDAVVRVPFHRVGGRRDGEVDFVRMHEGGGGDRVEAGHEGQDEGAQLLARDPRGESGEELCDVALTERGFLLGQEELLDPSSAALLEAAPSPAPRCSGGGWFCGAKTQTEAPLQGRPAGRRCLSPLAGRSRAGPRRCRLLGRGNGARFCGERDVVGGFGRAWPIEFVAVDHFGEEGMRAAVG